MFPGLMMAAAAGGTPTETGFTLVGAGATVDTGAGNAWTDPGNITLDDMSFAFTGVGTSVGGTTSDTLRGSTLGFAIPGGATIDGIELRVQCAYSTFLAGTPIIAGVVIGKDDTTIATPKTPATVLTTSFVNYTYGGASDLWGLSWTPPEINASTFQGLLGVFNSGTGQIVACQAMWVNVHYTV
jgi:hypothetical protein